MSTCSPGSQTSSCGSYPEPAMKCDTRGSPPTATSVPSQCAVSPTDCAGGGPTGEQCFFFSTEMANEASLEVEKHKFDSLVSWYFVNHGRYKVPRGGTTQPNQTSLEENADSSASRKRKLEDSLTSTDASDSKRRQTASVEPVLNLEASAIHSPTTAAPPPPTLSSSASVPAFVQMGQTGQEPLRKPDGPADATKRDENPLTRMEQMTRLTSFNANSITQLVDQPSSSREQSERERKMDKLGQIEGQLLSGGGGEEGGGASGAGEDKTSAKTEWDNMLMQHQVKKMMDGQQQQQPGSVPPPPATSSAQPSPVPGGPRSVGPPTGYPHPGSVPSHHHPLTPTYAHPFPPGPASAGAYPTGFPGATAGGGKGPYPGGPGGYPGFPGGAVPPGMSPGAYPHLPPGHPLRQNPAAYPLHHQHMMMMSRAHPAALSPGAPHPIFTAAPRASSTPMSPLFPPAHPAMRGAAPPPYPGYPGHPGMPGMHPGMMGPMPGMPGMPMGPGGPGGPAMTPQQQQQAAMHHHHQMMMMQHQQQQQHQQHQQRQAAAAAAAAAAGAAGGQAAMPASATQAPSGEQSWMSALQRPGMPQPGPSPGMMTGPSPGGMPAAASPMGMGPSPMNAMMYGPGSVGAAAASPATPQQA